MLIVSLEPVVSELKEEIDAPDLVENVELFPNAMSNLVDLNELVRPNALDEPLIMNFALLPIVHAIGTFGNDTAHD